MYIYLQYMCIRQFLHASAIVRHYSRQRTVESYPSGTTSSSHITSGLSLEHHTLQERDAHSLSPVPEEATSQQ